MFHNSNFYIKNSLTKLKDCFSQTEIKKVFSLSEMFLLTSMKGKRSDS